MTRKQALLTFCFALLIIPSLLATCTAQETAQDQRTRVSALYEKGAYQQAIDLCTQIVPDSYLVLKQGDHVEGTFRMGSEQRVKPQFTYRLGAAWYNATSLKEVV